MGGLSEKLESNEFVVTAEITPPKGTDVGRIRNVAMQLKEYIDAANATDNQRGIVRMSSMATCHILAEVGVEPVMQIACTHRNRIAIQSCVLGAHALNIPNLLIVTGDHVLLGDNPEAKAVYDVDSIQAIQLVKHMCDGYDSAGNELHPPPRIYVGATANPLADPLELQALRVEKKVEAGAKFIQTQVVFDVSRLIELLDLVEVPVHWLAGIMPLRSAKSARFINKRIPGIKVPDHIITRLEGAKKPAEEGVQMAIELCQELKNLKKISGIHIMTIAWEESVPLIIQGANLR